MIERRQILKKKWDLQALPCFTNTLGKQFSWTCCLALWQLCLLYAVLLELLLCVADDVVRRKRPQNWPKHLSCTSSSHTSSITTHPYTGITSALPTHSSGNPKHTHLHTLTQMHQSPIFCVLWPSFPLPICLLNNSWLSNFLWAAPGLGHRDLPSLPPGCPGGLWTCVSGRQTPAGWVTFA